MKLLISTTLQDLYGDALKWWSSDKELDCTIWVNSDVPNLEKISLYNTNKKFEVVSRSKKGQINFSDYDVIWNRRMHAKCLPSEYSEADRVIAQRSLKKMLDATLKISGIDAFTINDAASMIIAEDMPYYIVDRLLDVIVLKKGEKSRDEVIIVKN